ncbi:hypothetical protein TNCV_73071 [Trichonephila clavipes]|uniref:Mos1 transposase HTH domain-containing protein n=1 Tax=Trichonephila clavipes TaxID=2585209 RepID=A0A8X6RBK5_TRICX|nr:hypothetical protein TNCV_73071 [Trichonephila clavipes]
MGNLCVKIRNGILPEECRIYIKFLIKVKKSVTKAFQILTNAYGDETLFHAHVSEWYKRCLGGRVSVKDDKPAGRPKSAITDQKRVQINDMSGFSIKSMVRLLINTTTLNYKKQREKMRKKGPKLGTDGWFLHQVNASSHMGLSVKMFLTSKNITVILHSPYSLHFISSVFFNFSHLNLTDKEPI